MVVRRHVQPLRPEAVIGGREEPKVLAARIPHREHRIGEAIGDLLLLPRLDIRDKDRAVEGVEARGEGDPLRIGTPRRVQSPLRHRPGVVAEQLRQTGGHVHDPHIEIGIGVEDLLRVGRPRRRVVMLRVLDRDLARRRDPVLRFDDERVLPRLVGEVRDPLPVAGPRGLAFGSAARTGDVADIALFRGNREDLAAGLHHHALSGGRQGDVRHAGGDVVPARHHPGEIADRPNVDDVLAAGLRIEFVDVARLLEHNHIRAPVHRLHVVVGELRDLRQLLRGRLVRPDVRHSIAIGEEVDRVAHPDGFDVLGIGPGRRYEVVRLEVDDPDRPVLAAAVVAALIVPRVVDAIGDARSVRGDAALIRAGQRHRRLDPARGGHGPEPRRRGRRRGRARRRENNGRAVGRPPLHCIRARMPREALRLAAFGRHHVDIEISGVLGAEREPLAVRREAGIPGLALEARQSARHAARPFDRPDVVRVREGDMGRVHRRLPEQSRGRRGGVGGRCEGSERNEGSGQSQLHGENLGVRGWAKTAPKINPPLPRPAIEALPLDQSPRSSLSLARAQ